MTSGGELFIVDNSEAEWKGLRYLEEWTEIANSFDIAAGYFEMGALLALHGKWQKLDKIRILMGDEISVRTHQAILESLRSGIKSKLDDSIEAEKEKNDFLKGAPAIVEALRNRSEIAPCFRSTAGEGSQSSGTPRSGSGSRDCETPHRHSGRCLRE